MHPPRRTPPAPPLHLSPAAGQPPPDGRPGEKPGSVKLQGPIWSSPVIVDDVWIQGDCAGFLRAFDVSDTSVEPAQLWEIHLGGCIESTPAVWGGRIFVGTRAGQIFAVG